jgi:F0F1-type ATP synthase assembly protein I
MSERKVRHRRPVRSGKQSTTGEKAAERIRSGVINALSNRAVRLSLSSVIILAVLVGVAITWYNNVYANSERVFWGMIDNNLKTNSVTEEIKQTSATDSSDELTQMSFTPNPSVRYIKKITASNAQGSAQISVESIGTPKDTYQHYVSITQPGKPSSTFKDIYPLWLKNSGSPQSDTTLFNQKILNSANLFGNMPSAERAKTINYLHNAYHTNFDAVEKQKVDGRKVFIYKTKINLKDYIKAVHFYAESLGLPNADKLKPENYKKTDQFSVTYSVDVMSRQLKKVVYTNTSTQAQYSGYGIQANFHPPAHTVSYQKLQDTVKSASQ